MPTLKETEKDFIARLKGAFTDFDDIKAGVALTLLKARANALGLSFPQYMEAYHPYGIASPDSRIKAPYKAYVEFLADDSSALINAADTTDFSTFLHECGHVFRHQLLPEQLEKAEAALGVKDHQWTVEKEELFAYGLEAFIRTRADDVIPDKGYFAYQAKADRTLTRMEELVTAMRDYGDKAWEAEEDSDRKASEFEKALEKQKRLSEIRDPYQKKTAKLFTEYNKLRVSLGDDEHPFNKRFLVDNFVPAYVAETLRSDISNLKGSVAYYIEKKWRVKPGDVTEASVNPEMHELYTKAGGFVDDVYKGMDRIINFPPEMKEVYESLFSDKRYKFNKHEYRREVDQAANDYGNPDNHVFMGVTPPVYGELGLAPLPCLLSKENLRELLKKEYGLPILTAEMAEQIPEKMKEPLFIFQNPNDPDSLISILSFEDKDGKTVVLPLYQKRHGGYNRISFDKGFTQFCSNREQLLDFLVGANAEHELLYTNRKFDSLFFQSRDFKELIIPGSDVSGYYPANVENFRKAQSGKRRAGERTILFQAELKQPMFDFSSPEFGKTAVSESKSKSNPAPQGQETTYRYKDDKDRWDEAQGEAYQEIVLSDSDYSSKDEWKSEHITLSDIVVVSQALTNENEYYVTRNGEMLAHLKPEEAEHNLDDALEKAFSKYGRANIFFRDNARHNDGFRPAYKQGREKWFTEEGRIKTDIELVKAFHTAKTETEKNTSSFKPFFDKGVWDYTAYPANRILLANEKGILERPRPEWIPPMDQAAMDSLKFMPVFYKEGENFLVQAKTSDVETLEDNYHRHSTRVTKYRLSPEVLAASIDYYEKYQKALNKWNEEKDWKRRVAYAKWALMEPETRPEWTPADADSFRSVPSGEPFVSRTQKLDDYEREHFERYFNGYYKPSKARPVRTLSKNLMHHGQFDFMEANGISGRRQQWANYNAWRAEIDQKMLDMSCQLADYESTYAKGKETSYGDSGTDEALKKEYGVLVKRQNGDPINKAEIAELKAAIESVYRVYGDQKETAEKYGLKISHAAEKNMHARKASGIFFDYYHAIGVSFANPDTAPFILGHEMAHFLDAQAGKDLKHYFASDLSGTPENDIARTLRQGMNADLHIMKSDYYNRTCECFARAMEQYCAYKTSSEYYALYASQMSYMSDKKFKEEIVPLVEERLFKERSQLYHPINDFAALERKVLEMYPHLKEPRNCSPFEDSHLIVTYEKALSHHSNVTAKYDQAILSGELDKKAEDIIYKKLSSDNLLENSYKEIKKRNIERPIDFPIKPENNTADKFRGNVKELQKHEAWKGKSVEAAKDLVRMADKEERQKIIQSLTSRKAPSPEVQRMISYIIKNEDPVKPRTVPRSPSQSHSR